MNPLKQISALIFLAALILSVSACNYSLMSAETNTDTSMSKTYARSNETEERVITVNEGEQVEVTFNVVSNEGVINFDLVNDEGESFYEGSDVDTSNFTVNLDEAGDYTLTIVTETHSGSFNISWEVAE